MPGTRPGIAGIGLLVLLVLPRAASAGIIDIIWEMSGPQMVGIVVYRCEYDLVDRTSQCRHFLESGLPKYHKTWWLTFDSAAYTSTAKDPGDDNPDVHYDWFDVGMVAFEPMLKLRSHPRVHHGAGLSYNFLFGRDFSRFDKVGLRFEPAAVRLFGRWVATYTYRVYPHGFTKDEFGVGPRMFDLDRGPERVQGINLAIDW